MTLIAGASQFLNSSTLANTQGRAAQAPSLLSGISLSLLDMGRISSNNGVGLSARSRALTQEYLNGAQGLANALLSAPAEQNTTSNLYKQILALRSSLPDDAIDDGVFILDDGTISEEGQKTLGTKVSAKV